MSQSLEIDIAGHRGFADLRRLLAIANASRLFQNAAVFRDQAMTAEDQIRSRFTRPRRGVGVGRDAASRLAANQITSPRRFADRFVAGRQIQQHIGAGHRRMTAGLESVSTRSSQISTAIVLRPN